MHLWFNPKLVQGKKLLEDPETNQPVTRDELIQAYHEYARFIFLLHDIDSGIIHLTLSEYKRLPVPALKAIRLYRTMKSDYEQTKES